MKTYRILVVVLSLLVLGLGYLALSNSKKPPVEVAKEMWHTNTVERWHTNSIEVTHTTTLTTPVTNEVVKEVVKEVPARLSALERQAAVSGYNFINAPLLETTSERLYKANPITVDVSVSPSAAGMVTEDPASITKSIELALGSRNIPVAEKSPYHLSLNISRSWGTDVPGVGVLVSRLELRQNVVLKRQSAVIQCPAVVWNTAASKLTRTFTLGEDLKALIQESVDKFCNDYLEAKQREKLVESRLPAMPQDFLAQRK